MTAPLLTATPLLAYASRAWHWLVLVDGDPVVVRVEIARGVPVAVAVDTADEVRACARAAAVQAIRALLGLAPSASA